MNTSTAAGLVRDGGREAVSIAASTTARGAGRTALREAERERQYVRDADSTLSRVIRAGQSGTNIVGVMLVIVVAAAIGFVGTKVGSELEDSITDKDLSNTDAGNQTIYENTTESIGGGFADAMGLTDIVFLILIFSVILGALLAFRGNR